MCDRIGGVVHHLSHDFPSNAGVRAPLHLNEGRNGVLVEEKVVK